MSAISEYVHYRAYSYLNNNPRIEGSDLIAYATKKVSQRIEQSKSGMSQQEKERLLNIINAFMGRGSNLDQDQKMEIEKRYLDLEKSFLEEYKNHTLDRISGKVSQIIEGKAIKARPQRAVMSVNEVDKFIRDYNALLGKLNSLKNDGTISEEKKKKYKDAYNDLIKNLKKLDNLKKASDAEIRKNAPSGFEKVKGLAHTPSFQGKTFAQLEGDLESMKDAFNTALSNTGLSLAGASLAQGSLFESIVEKSAETALDFAFGKLNHEFASIVREGPKGADAWVEIDPLATNWSETAVTEIHGDVIVQFHKNYSQGKTDVKISYKRPSDFKLMNLNISAKSYSSLSRIKIVDNTTTWAILSGENSIYRKAFMNIMSQHSQNLESIYGQTEKNNSYYSSLKKSEEASKKRLADQKKDAVIMFKILAAYKALTGDVYKREAANIFLINDVTSQKIYLLEMQDIFNAILLQMAKDSSAIGKYFEYNISPSLERGYINKWVDASAIARVEKIWQQTHKQKIEVIFKGSQEKFLKMGTSIDTFGNIT